MGRLSWVTMQLHALVIICAESTCPTDWARWLVQAPHPLPLTPLHTGHWHTSPQLGVLGGGGVYRIVTEYEAWVSVCVCGDLKLTHNTHTHTVPCDWHTASATGKHFVGQCTVYHGYPVDTTNTTWNLNCSHSPGWLKSTFWTTEILEIIFSGQRASFIFQVCNSSSIRLKQVMQ